MILRAGASGRVARSARVLAAIESARGSSAALAAEGSPLQLTAEERASVARILGGDVDAHNTHVRKYVLLRLDADIAGRVPASGFATITVEHVLPQNPPAGSQWASWFPNHQERARYTHCLGNLVLLSRARNTAAANYEFAHKKRAYFAPGEGETPLALTAQVLREDRWTPAVVERRQRALLERLRRLWRL